MAGIRAFLDEHHEYLTDKPAAPVSRSMLRKALRSMLEDVERGRVPCKVFTRAEYEQAIQALRTAHGNKRVAAQAMGMGLSTFYRRLRATTGMYGGTTES